jgi:hypothetical protein
VRRKIPDWKRYAGIVADTRAAAQRLDSGLKISPGGWQRLPDYVHPALKAIEAERAWRLAEPDRPDKLRWLARLVREFVLTTEVALRDYERCFKLSVGIFTDASFEAVKRTFKAFPSPAELLKFLIDWGEEHRPSNLPNKDRRHSHRRLILTDADRQRLLSVEAGNELTKCHVRIAHTLASWPHAYGQPSHQHLASATGTSVRTVPRALRALRAIGLLPDDKGRVMPIKLPEQVRDFQPAMAAIAAHAGRSVKTLYRWEQDLRALRGARAGKPRQEWRPKGPPARRMRGNA